MSTYGLAEVLDIITSADGDYVDDLDLHVSARHDGEVAYIGLWRDGDEPGVPGETFRVTIERVSP